MKDFKKAGGFGGGRRGGSFAKGGFDRGVSQDGGFRGGGGRDFSRPKEMHQATCANCKKRCEVPFRPNGKKPVFCRDCFANNRGDSPERTFSRAENTPRPSYRPEGGERRGGDEVKSQIEALTVKIDTLMRMVKALEHTPKADAVPAVKVLKLKTAGKALKK